MAELKEFIDILDNVIWKKDALDNAIKYVKDDLHIGKIVIDSKELLEHYEFLEDEIEPACLVEYKHDKHTYIYYKRNDGYFLKPDDIEKINIMLRIISMHHDKFLLENKVEEATLTTHISGLPNVRGFMKKVNELFGHVNLSNYNSYYINIKGFGLINKLFGSDQGNIAIKEYANSLKNFSNNDEIVGHLGGDNFIAFIKKERHEAFINLATMCQVTIKSNNEDKKINLIGVVGYSDNIPNELNYDKIVSEPSIACQFARSNKKIVVKITDELIDITNTSKSIERTFKDDLSSGNFVVYYQPKFDIKSGKIIGVEALSRWIKDDKIIPPGMFVPILEKNGEIIDLDLFVLETLCKDIHNYRNLGHLIVPASCNISRRDFEDKNIENKIISLIKKYDVKTEDIVIEVTETTNLEEKERLAKFIEVMHKNGIMTSVDDFGTGYSSLSVLRDFKVNEIKIDRSFINREALNNSDEIIIGSIIDMAKRLNIDVICEGVETPVQANFLLKLGCNNAQGFLYSKPLPKLEFEALMRKVGTVYDEK